MGGDAERQEQFADFVRANYARLTRTAYLLVGDRGHAEDLVQSALVTTLGAWDRRAVDAPLAYTRTTMVRLAGRRGRRRWRGEVATGEIPEGTAQDQPSREDGLDVRRALARLPWEQRAVLVLRYFEDLSERDTAALLGCSVGTVKSRSSRALEALRRGGIVTNAEVSNG